MATLGTFGSETVLVGDAHHLCCDESNAVCFWSVVPEAPRVSSSYRPRTMMAFRRCRRDWLDDDAVYALLWIRAGEWIAVLSDGIFTI
jgi:hypothetical protein